MNTAQPLPLKIITHFTILVISTSFLYSTIQGFSASTNSLQTNMTTYLGSTGTDRANVVEIAPDDTIVVGGLLQTTENLSLTPTNIRGGGVGYVMRFASDGKTPLSMTRFPLEIEDLDIDSTNGNIAIADASGFSYMNSTATIETFRQSPTREPTPNAGSLERVDIGADGKIAYLGGERFSVWSTAGVNLSFNTTDSRSVVGKIVRDIALDSTNNQVVIIGETQKDDAANCSQWRAGWMRSYSYTGGVTWTNYDWTPPQVNNVTPYNLCPDFIPNRVSIGRDSKLYMTGEAPSGRTVLDHNPRNLSQGGKSLEHERCGSQWLGWKVRARDRQF
jgi:hypothetical protein